MARPSDREYALKRKVKEQEEKIHILEIENKRLKQQLEKLQSVPELSVKKGKKEKPKVRECPDCGAEVKESELPHGNLLLCSKACGYREVRSK